MESYLETVLRLKGKYIKGSIENWLMIIYDDKKCVIGDFYSIDNSPVIDIRTSSIIEFHKEYSIIETKNSAYKLGQPSPYTDF